MLTSMTGYGQGETRSDTVLVRVEIRSVNHRFQDIQVRLPRPYMTLEPRIAGKVREVHHRGRVEVTVHVTRLAGTSHLVRIDPFLAREYLSQLRRLQADLALSGEIRLDHILQLGGVVTTMEMEQDPEADWPAIQEALDLALAACTLMRRAEGQAMTADIAARVHSIADYHRRIAELSEPLRMEIEQRLEERVTAVLERVGAGEIDRGRLLQEVTYLVDRADVSEEIARLRSHVEQLSDLLEQDGPQGKRMEFLLQEMVREVNTIGSKTNHEDVLRLVMMTKVELEKIREQVQNVE